MFYAVVALGLVAGRVSAVDTITVATGQDGKGRSRITGQIIDYTGEALRLELPSGREQKIASERIVEVETTWQANHTAGDRLLVERKYGDALDRYRAALGQEQRRWAQRRILAQCVWCQQHLEQWGQAAETFLTIYRSDRATQYLPSIPLVWTAPHWLNDSLQASAASWLAAADSPAASLLGASWLLTTDRQAAAQEALRRLSTDRDARIAFLAEAQRWRTRVLTADRQEVDRWREWIRRMPDDLRPGPWFTLGLALARQGLHEQAALAHLRVPILYSSHRSLAAESLLAAGRELELLGQRDEAVGLYREVTAVHGGVAAATARSRLENLRRPKTD